VPGGARNLGQPLGAEHQQRHDADDHEFRKTDVEHLIRLM
jgi:hypothetical protein